MAKYIIHDSNGKILHEGRSFAYAERKLRSYWKKNPLWIMCSRKHNLQFWQNKHDGSKRNIMSTGKSINHGDYQIDLDIICD